MTEYRRRKAAHAMQFDGSEESAAAVIEWGAGLSQPIEIERYGYVDVHEQNGGPRELWLTVHWCGCTLTPGEWMVSDDDVVDVFTSANFEALYEQVVAA